ncbi:MAG TPA: quinol oxidase [Methylophilaceae bacterium]|nr:quinol oxidase [Methylophilaceae bacterium]
MKSVAASILFMAAISIPPALAEEPPPSHAPPEETYRAFTAPDGIQHVSIVGGNYFFRPNRVIVKVNVPVELGVTLERGIVPHSLVIDAPEAGIQVDQKLSSEPKKIRFTPTATGSFTFYCKNKLLFLKSHRAKGMEGTLEVID